jgi:hypothetical protein
MRVASKKGEASPSGRTSLRPTPSAGDTPATPPPAPKGLSLEAGPTGASLGGGVRGDSGGSPYGGRIARCERFGSPGAGGLHRPAQEVRTVRRRRSAPSGARGPAGASLGRGLKGKSGGPPFWGEPTPTRGAPHRGLPWGRRDGKERRLPLRGRDSHTTRIENGKWIMGDGCACEGNIRGSSFSGHTLPSVRTHSAKCAGTLCRVRGHTLLSARAHSAKCAGTLC